MGRRRGRTGPGGAVVSSRSQNPGGVVRGGGDGKKSNSSSSNSRRQEDHELNQLANLATSGTRNSSQAGSSNASSTNRQSSKWLGKTPQQALGEWCSKNNRKRPYFSKMGETGLVHCTVPRGRKDGRPVKGSAFDPIMGVGRKPGEEHAALIVLHQVEYGKPLERMFAPEFKETWLSFDKLREEIQHQDVQRTEMALRRKQTTERRAKFEKNKESATLNISAASRQLIEDALLERKTNSEQEAVLLDVSDSSSMKVRRELLSLGFSNFDASDASQRFSTAPKALDYLCLNLDESELPVSFAAKADVEVVQFYKQESIEGFRGIDTQLRDALCRHLCLSRYAAERALKKANGNFDNAFVILYEILTHGIFVNSPSKQLRSVAPDELKCQESEILSAIYMDDLIVGRGVCPGFPNHWSAIIDIREGFPNIKYSKKASVAFIDLDHQYPFSAPAVIVVESFEKGSTSASLPPPQRRLLMRSAAGKVAELCNARSQSESSELAEMDPVHVIYDVISFLSEGSAEEVFKFASKEKLTSKEESMNDVTKKLDETSRKDSLSGKSRNRVDQLLHAEPLKMSKGLMEMVTKRKSLPAYHSREEIVSTIQKHQVVVISGETGSGKTTQVPQFLLEEATQRRHPIMIVCTQPRRIAAMSVAERVAAERCQKVGESVGYQIKLNTKRSRQTRLLFCTTGVLLRRLHSDPSLNSFSHVIIDEVHERSSETDFLMLLLRELLPSRPKLRVILMSATADSEKFASYFSSLPSKLNPIRPKVPVVLIQGRTFPVQQFYLEEAVKYTGYVLKPNDQYAKRSRRVARSLKYGREPTEQEVKLSVRQNATTAAAIDDPCSDDFSDEEHNPTTHTEKKFHLNRNSAGQDTQNALNRSYPVSLIDESHVNLDLIDMLVKQIDKDGRRRNESGAILIFLPGTAEIFAMMQKLTAGEGSNRLWPLPLHSLLSPDDQSKVFRSPPNTKRKVICSTNIAETSITVNDVTVVIDSVRAKETSYDALNGSSVLAECFVSRASAKQRAGRAGRVSKGTCYRLVRRHTFENTLAAHQKPEIQRIALEHLVLNVLSVVPDVHSQNDPHLFFSKAIDPPENQSVTTAVNNLIEIGALQSMDNKPRSDEMGVELTALGKHLAGLPVDVRIGKLLIYGSLFSCLDICLTIAATISERSPFFAPISKREEARSAKAKFSWGKSDLLTYVKAFDAWRELRDSRVGYAAEQKFCSDNFLSRKSLMTISDGRKRLADALGDIGFGGRGRQTFGWERNDQLNQNSNNVRMVRAIICAALYPNVARIDLPDTKYREVAGGAVPVPYHSKDLRLRTKGHVRLFLHPESVNFHVGSYETRWLAYYEKVHTSKLFIRDSTMISPFALLLFGGEIGVDHKQGKMSVDKWAIFKAPAQIAVLARELRRELDGILMRKFEDADLDLNQEGSGVKDAIVRLITRES